MVRILRVVSCPVSSGIIMSIKMRSYTQNGSASRMHCSAAAPLEAKSMLVKPRCCNLSVITLATMFFFLVGDQFCLTGCYKK